MSEALLARKKLSAELAHLRMAADETQVRIAEALWWSPSKVHRIEQGRVAVTKTDLEAILRYFNVADTEKIDRLLRLAQLSQDKRQPYYEYRDIFGTDVIEFFGYEEVASHIRELQMLLVPGLLQTPDYTRELISAGQGLPKEAERFVASRQKRQSLLQPTGSRRLSFIVDEAVLYRSLGGRRVMEPQLRRLQEVAALPHVSIQILDLSRGAHPGLRGSFTLLEFRSPDYPDIVFTENRVGDLLEHEVAATRARREQWTALDSEYVSQKSLDYYVDRALDLL